MSANGVRVERIHEVTVSVGLSGGPTVPTGTYLRELERFCEELRGAGAGGDQFVSLAAAAEKFSMALSATVGQPWPRSRDVDPSPVSGGTA